MASNPDAISKDHRLMPPISVDAMRGTNETVRIILASNVELCEVELR